MDRLDLEKKLGPKRVAFCKEYVVDWNASRAARDAGYSPKTAGSQAYDLLKIPEIKEYIEIIKNELEELSGVSKLRNLQTLAKVAYSNDLSHLHNTWIDLKDWEALSAKDKAGLKSIDRRITRRVEGINDDEIEVEQIKIECFDRRLYIETINKMMGYNDPETSVVTIDTASIKWGDSEIKV